MRNFIIRILILLSLINVSINGESTLHYSNDVIFFEDEQEEGERIYTLKIKGTIYSYSYPVIVENGKYYLSVIDFFRAIHLKNFSTNKGVITAELGKNLDRVEIDFKKLTPKEYLYKSGKYYLSAKLFKDYFLYEIRWNDNKSIVNMNPNFSIPDIIQLDIDTEERHFKMESDKPLLKYTGKRELINAGNLRVNLQQDFNNDTGSKSNRDWDGYLEYNGSLLYGILNTDYDLKEHKFGDVTITYPDIMEKYQLEIGAYGEHREKGLSFKKDRGYFNDGKEYVIEENVPLGSRAELLYNHIPIEIEHEEDGKVIFTNSLIKENREFILKIYTPDGTIFEKLIKINKDYNLQNKNEFGFDIYARDEYDSKRVDSHTNIYYGYTEHLTFGFGYEQTPKLIEGHYTSLKNANIEAIYGNMISGNPYTLTYEYSQGLNSAKNWYTTDEGKYSDKKYNNKHKFLIDTTIKKLDITYEHYENGKYYDTKREQYLHLDYDITDWLSLKYRYEENKYWYKSSKNDYDYGLSINQSWKNFLVNFDINKNKKGEITKELDFYYTGMKYFIVKLQNDWNEKNEYKGELTLTNKNWTDSLDYSVKMKYTPKEKVVYTFDFTLKLDNWFEIGTSLEKGGRKNTHVGIDRVINLKNPKVNMNSLENTNIKAIAFLDKNNNNKFDKGEKRVPNVEVNVGEHFAVTDENGVAYIYGIPSFIDYEIKTTYRKPSFDSNTNIIHARGIGATQTEVLIPVKPMISFFGMVELEGYDHYEQEVIMSDLSISISNKKKNVNKTIYADSDGIFYIQDILPGKYTFKIKYNGDEHKFKEKTVELNLIYSSENRGENEHTFKIVKGE